MIIFIFSVTVQKHFQSYTDPEETQVPLSGDTSSPTPDSSIALPLDDSVLTHNLGIPLIVVCCKVIRVTLHRKSVCILFFFFLFFFENMNILYFMVLKKLCHPHLGVACYFKFLYITH